MMPITKAQVHSAVESGPVVGAQRAMTARERRVRTRVPLSAHGPRAEWLMYRDRRTCGRRGSYEVFNPRTSARRREVQGRKGRECSCVLYRWYGVL